MAKVIDISQVLEERIELAICTMWDEFYAAAEQLYLWRDFENLVLVLQAIERVKGSIETVKDG